MTEQTNVQASKVSESVAYPSHCSDQAAMQKLYWQGVIPVQDQASGSLRRG